MGRIASLASAAAFAEAREESYRAAVNDLLAALESDREENCPCSCP
jgi:hypothetical protein